MVHPPICIYANVCGGIWQGAEVFIKGQEGQSDTHRRGMNVSLHLK